MREAIKEDYEDFWQEVEKNGATPVCKNDAVSHPAHYTAGKVECIDAIESATTGLEGIEAFCIGNAIKYLWRWKWKGGVQDLEKAKWYIERLIARALRTS